MTVFRAFLITIISTVVCGLLGALGGYSLAINAPGYYMIVFQLSDPTTEQLVQLGVGLGVTQGLGVGIVMGLVIVVTVGLYNGWAKKLEAEQGNADL